MSGTTADDNTAAPLLAVCNPMPSSDYLISTDNNSAREAATRLSGGGCSIWCRIALVASWVVTLVGAYYAGVGTEMLHPAGCSVKPACVDGTFVYSDQHDGDEKRVTIAGALLTIQPHANDQTWMVNATFQPSTCIAPFVDFNVPGKPSPPGMNLTLTIFTLGQRAPCSTKQALIFTLNTTSSTPLNTWVQL